MSRSGKISRFKKGLPQLVHSVLFRRLILSWTIILAALLILTVGALIVTVNAIYSENEREYLSSVTEQATMLRRMAAEGSVSEEDAAGLLSAMCAASGYNSYIFTNEPGGAVIADRALHDGGVSPEDAELIKIAEELFDTGSLYKVRLKIGGMSFVAAGNIIKMDEGPDQAVVCMKSILDLQKRQMRLLLYVIAFILATLLIGVCVITIHVSNYIIPFTEVARAAIDMSYGNLNTRVKLDDERGEIGLLSRSFNRLSASLSQNFIQLEQERSRLVQIVNSSSNGIAVIDEHGELIQYNPALLELFSQMRLNSKYDISEDRRLMVIPDKTIWERFDKVNKAGMSERMVYPADAERMLWINISPVISAEGEQVGVVGNFQDMTELERLERTRREYVANVSHELRRPLTALQGLLEPIRDGLVTEEADKQRYYDIMLHEIERLSRLISDMMQLSRLQSDKIKMQMEPLDLSEIAADVAESYRSDIEGRSMRLIVDTPPGMVANIDADRAEQVLIVLLDNAIKFTPDSGSITIRTFRSGDSVCMEVADTGCGISKEDIPHIFERFYKADKSHASEGTGLGLSIADNIIRKMQGSISCISELDKGTTMRVTFKAYVPKDDESGENINGAVL